MELLTSYTLKTDNARDLVQKALTNLEWNYRFTKLGYHVNFDMNMYTWGSNMQINILDRDKISIHIKTKIPFQIIDWGDGKNKINELIEEINNLSNV